MSRTDTVSAIASPQHVPATTTERDRASHVPVPLHLEARTALSTNEAAFHLGRRPQTLRRWASTGEGAVRPTRVHGRLAWPVSEIRRVLGVSQ